jgi:hypothetical protein
MSNTTKSHFLPEGILLRKAARRLLLLAAAHVLQKNGTHVLMSKEVLCLN